MLDLRTNQIELAHRFDQVMDRGMIIRDRHLIYIQYFYTLDELTYIYEINTQTFDARKS